MIDANNLQLFTVRDAAKLLDMSEHTIRRLIKQRKLAVVRIEQRIHGHQERNRTLNQEEHLRNSKPVS